MSDDSDHRDCAYLEEQWIEKDGKVYRRIRWEGEEWSELEEMPNGLPFFILPAAPGERA